MVETEYKGYTIRETDEPWALKYGYKYEYFNDERVLHAKTLEEAKEEIDERTDRFENFLNSKINDND
jgi:hypothetical protein